MTFLNPKVFDCRKEPGRRVVHWMDANKALLQLLDFLLSCGALGVSVMEVFAFLQFKALVVLVVKVLEI